MFNRLKGLAFKLPIVKQFIEDLAMMETRFKEIYGGPISDCFGIAAIGFVGYILLRGIDRKPASQVIKFTSVIKICSIVIRMLFGEV